MRRKYALVLMLYSGKILLGRKRSKRKSRTGTLPWVVPGGTIEEGETPEHCAQREAREETDKDIPPERFEFRGVAIDEARESEYHVFIVALSRNEFREKPPPYREFTELRWFDQVDLPWEEMLPEHEEWLPRMLFTDTPLYFSVNHKT